MTDEALARAACEVNEVLRYVDEVDVKKIPLGLRLFLKDVSDKDYIVTIRPDLSLEDNHLMQETQDILGMLYYFYWRDELEEVPQEVKDETIRASEKIFGNYSESEFTKKVVEKHEQQVQAESIAPVPKIPWYKKLFSWLRKK